jgi:hypothetical protein
MEHCYDAIGQLACLQFDIYDKPYTFTLQAQQRMLEWFDRRV